MYVIDKKREEIEIWQRFENLLHACNQIKVLSPEETESIQKAFALANKAHAGIRRKSGEPYIFHPLAVALIAVNEIGLGPTAVVCALLHDVVEDTDTSIDEVRMIFGDRVAIIIDGLTKINDMGALQPNTSKQAETYRKILLSMCDDVYVIFLKLCDRLHNMRTLDAMNETKKLTISSETQYLYIPLAHRLGLYNIKTELEELVMKYTNPEKFNEVSQLIKATLGKEEELVQCLTNPIKQMLNDNGYKYTLKSRVKSIYSCWKKMEQKGVAFEEIFDLYAMRIILDVPLEHEKEECFKVYGLITSKFPPNPERFRDWINSPKNNGYESLHTTVMTPIGQWAEIQIRTERMDSVAEKGMAAHFIYKEAHPEEVQTENPVETWLQQIRSTLETTDKSAIDLVESFRETLYTKEIYLFTPKGDTIILPSYATVLDFAFAIHTDLGLHCMGAKVNGRVVSNSYKLQSGQKVQLITSKKTIPTEEWLEYVHTSSARESLKDYLRAQRKPYVDTGKNKLDSLFKKCSVRNGPEEVAKLKKYCKISSDTDFYYLLAINRIGEKEILACFNKNKPSPQFMFLNPFRSLFGIKEGKNENNLEHLLPIDQQNLPTVAATCCNPIPGDSVIGIIEDSKVMVHRTNCSHAINTMANHENKIIQAKWQPNKQVELLTGLTITTMDRVGILQEITNLISEEFRINMRAFTFESIDGIGRGMVMLYINSVEKLNTLIERLKSIDGIKDVRRI